MEGFLCVGGIEIANPCRTLAYLRSLGNACLPAPPGPAEDCCCCPDWAPLLSGPGLIVPPGATLVAPDTVPAVETGYLTPAEDDAPWYDPAVPASADVLGVWIDEWSTPTPWARTMRPTLRGGALGPGRLGPREITVTGRVYTRSAAATQYARTWLFEAMAGDPCAGSCDLPDLVLWRHCDTAQTPGDGKRTIKRVGLTGFDDDLDPMYPKWCGFRFEATFAAEVPEMFLDPFDTVSVPLAAGYELCLLCDEPVAIEGDTCACGCGEAPLRYVPVPDPVSCYCMPPYAQRVTASAEPPRLWTDATAIIRIYAGADPANPAAPLANLRIRGWSNPVGLPAPDEETDPFATRAPCLDIEVGCVPASAVLTIDGTTRQATVTCNGEDRSAYYYLSSGGGGLFSWPDIACSGLMLVIDADPNNTPPNARVEFEFVGRERA